MEPFEYVIKAEGYTFHLLLTKFYDRNTGNISSININLGGQFEKCLNINILANKDTGILSWVKKHAKCSLEENEPKTQLLILLGISIAKSIKDDLRYIELDDMSYFPCKLPDGKSYQVEMKPFHIAFHQSTWYEYYFNAKMIDDNEYNKYVSLKANFMNPQNKPDTFDFINNTLKDKLDPLYNTTSTWAEFFKEISQAYGNKKCAIVYPWIKNAIKQIVGSKYVLETEWVIDLENNNKIIPINFEAYDTKWSGGKRGRKKTRKANKSLWQPWQAPIRLHKVGHGFAYGTIYQWNYTKFLK